MRASAAHSVLLRITPPIPCSLDGGVDQLEPLIFGRVVGRWWQREQLPPPFIADHRHDRLTAWPAHMAIGARALRVGGHEALLHGEDEIVCSSQGRGWHWWIVSAQPDLKIADGLAKWLRRFSAVIEMECLDLIQQHV